jgi:predicted HTH domain antitoxin
MKLIIPDDIVQRAEVGEGDLRIALALQLYADNRLDHADACRLAQLSAGQLNEELLRAGLSIQQYPRVSLAQRRRSAG